MSLHFLGHKPVCDKVNLTVAIMDGLEKARNPLKTGPNFLPDVEL